MSSIKTKEIDQKLPVDDTDDFIQSHRDSFFPINDKQEEIEEIDLEPDAEIGMGLSIFAIIIELIQIWGRD